MDQTKSTDERMICAERNRLMRNELERDRAAMRKPANSRARAEAMRMIAMLYAAGFANDDQIALELDHHLGLHEFQHGAGGLLEFSTLGSDVQIVVFRAARQVVELGLDRAMEDDAVFWLDYMAKLGPMLPGAGRWH